MKKLINKSCNAKQFAAFIVYLFVCAVLAKLMLKGFGDSPHIREVVGGGVLLAFLCASRNTFWCLSFPLALLSSIYAPIAYIYGQPDFQSLISVLSTNLSETNDFLSDIPFRAYKRSLEIILSIFIVYFLAIKFNIKPWRNKTFVILSVIVLACIVGLTSFFSSLLHGVIATKEEMAALEKFVNKSSWGASKFNGEFQNYVLIIGESARKDYFSAYGYPIDTTPFMSKAPGLLVDGLIAGNSYTVGSLRLMLTHADTKMWSPRYDFNIIDLAKSAGLKTIWLSNQGFIGEHDTPISSIGYRSDEHRFPVAGEYHKNGLSDFFLLERFQSILSMEREQPMLIVLHTIGSHPDACKKISDVQNKFIATDEKYKYLTCYINTILKTDAFVERLFNLLKKNEIENGRRFSMIYFADHGQAHYHDSNKIILNNNSISALHYEVPLIKIDSYSFDRKINKSRKYGVRFVDGLANWMGIENKNISAYDLFDGVNDEYDYGYQKILAEKKPIDDPAIDLRPYLTKKIDAVY